MKRMLVMFAAGAVGALSGRTVPKATGLAPAAAPAPTRAAAPPDLGALLIAARGAPPLLCALAARSVRDYGDYGWGGADAPASPLGRAVTDAPPDDGGDGRHLTDADRGRLLDALASDDACVRELSVRLLGRRRDSSVVAPLVARLTGPNAPLRAAAAMGLGLAAPATTRPSYARPWWGRSAGSTRPGPPGCLTACSARTPHRTSAAWRRGDSASSGRPATRHSSPRSSGARWRATPTLACARWPRGRSRSAGGVAGRPPRRS